MTGTRDYDIVVIGSGPAGRRAAVQAAKLGRSALVIEKMSGVGGVCVHTGTIPSKTLREAVLSLTGWRERGIYGSGWRVKKDITAADLRARLDQTVEREVDVLDHQFARNGVTVAHGAARFVDGHHVEIASGSGELLRVVSADRILIAVGTRPFRPDDVPFDDRIVVDSDSILALERLPRSLTVIGAGVIGIEYATIFAALDIQVTLVDARETILDFVDREIIADFMHDLSDYGMVLRLGTRVKSIRKNGDQAVAELEDGRQVCSDMLLYTGGRTGATDGLNLEACGLAADARGRLKVDPQTLQTAMPDIYAAGDVIGFPALAATSLEQGRLAACHAFGYELPAPEPVFPYGIYAVPEISTIGLNEEEARAKSIPYECGIARFRETSRGHVTGPGSGMLKLVISLQTRKLLGIHIVGESATELIHIGQAVLTLGGTFDYFLNATFNYPTLAEAYKIAALDAWNRMMPRRDGRAPL
ncbi:Si-specific NAD(P)(+) transhydrogenase [Acetobacter fallax]|uniref:Soluble pyridine nucleotide transhydrogenase n=1 Tax=Acetobacter fallax TaxID=1737473 RepID=A0ABX0KCH8_9PROT|nr:Si-specific NAD(P)(+) transhydrogenase [Acetobacter fallax]NHO36815.1 Si-specific NAD(P)(+) transhydrogenase [Acetobacter fallax]